MQAIPTMRAAYGHFLLRANLSMKNCFRPDLRLRNDNAIESMTHEREFPSSRESATDNFLIQIGLSYEMN